MMPISKSIKKYRYEEGRSVSHISEACVSCRRLKVRCSGEKPCFECSKRGKIEMCIYEGGRRRGRKSTYDEEEEDDDDDQGTSAETQSMRGERGDRGSNSGSSSSSKTGQQSMMIVAERLLADETTGKFLMDIFIRRIHPHTYALSSTSPSFVFEKLLGQAMKASDAIQRDAGLAMACQMCGHDSLGHSLIRRMEQNYEKVREEPISQESYSAIALLSTIMMNESVTKAIEMIRRSFALHQALYPPIDSISSTCEFLETLSLSSSSDTGSPRPHFGMELALLVGCSDVNGMYNDWESLTKEEITAHVKMTVSQTLEDIQLRHLVGVFLARLTGIALPPMRPPFAMQVGLFFDMHLLGCLIPPYIMEIMLEHDPERKFSVNALFKPCVRAPGESQEAYDLSEEIAATLLRRVLVCRMLLFTSGLNMDVISSFLVSVEILEMMIRWRSNDRERASKIGQWILQYIETKDLNFWPPMISQNLFLLGSIFFEMNDALDLMRTICELDKLRRSQSIVAIGVQVLNELQLRMMPDDK